MHSRWLFPVLFAGSLLAGPAVRASGTAGQDLHDLVEAYYEESLLLNPILATYHGDYRYDDRFVVEISPENMEAARLLEARYLDAIGDVAPRALDERDRLTWEIFRREREVTLAGFQFPGHLIPVDQFFCVPLLLVMMGAGGSIQPLGTVEDHDAWLKRVRGFDAWVDQAIANMREGVEKKIVQPRAIMERVLPQLASLAVAEPDRSPFYGPVRSFPDDFPAEARTRLTRDYAETIRTSIAPAYGRLHDYIRDEYMEHTRETIGLSALPGGREWYAYLVRAQTTTDLTPEEIHEIGLAEVARLRRAIDDVREEPGDLPPDGDAGFESPQAMLDAYRALRAVVEPAAASLFHEFPKADFEIRPVDPLRQGTSAGAYYVAGTPDGSRPGVFYVNTRSWNRWSRGAVEALFLHEAVPGHHFQISVQRELEKLPRFRRFGQFNAYAEGWGLYAETLGKELGLYRSAEDRRAALRSELFRARRLVADTGIHAMGWTRKKAIDYVGSVSEVDRYVAMPGQALSYKIGQLRILELRARAEERLGDAFDIRAFHTAVLGEGAMPLDALEAHVEGWIEEAADEPTALAILNAQAEALRPLVHAPLARAFLDASRELPPISGVRVAYYNRETRDALTEGEAAGRDEEALEGYERMELDEHFYYFTKYGTPLAVTRPLEILGAAGRQGVSGSRVLDFGFGSAGQLRVLASLGAAVTGVEVDRLLQVLYSREGDTGAVPRARAAGEGPAGTVRMLFGRFPAEDALVREAGTGYDVFLSKNTLKRGYIHPAEEVDPRRLVHLGVDDDTYVTTVFRLLNPGGYFLIYNLCPPPNPKGEPYIPWADGRSPFDRALYERAGFEVIAFDADDTEPARAMGRALGWGEHMNLDEDLFGIYTLVRKPF